MMGNRLNAVAGFVCVALLALSTALHAEGEIRVVSLSPCLTETIFKLGGGDRLVGRTSACDYPRKVSEIECVGGFGKPSLEKLLSLKPTVVVASALADPAVRTTIERVGVKFVMLSTKSIDDYYATVKTLGDILGRPEAAAKEIERVRKGLAKYAAANRKAIEKGWNPPRVYLEIWDKPFMTVGRRSFINDLITYAGGRNIAADRDEDYFNCSQEWIIRANPEVVICPAMKTGRIADVLGRRGWGGTAAVGNKRVYVDLNDDLIYRLGPRILEGVALLRKLTGVDDALGAE
jgi:iron complex transport system substrate-binding protein